MRQTLLRGILLLGMLSSSWVYLTSLQTISFAQNGPLAKATFYVH